MANFYNYEVLNEVELDACADELSKECAALVLEEPFISTLPMPVNDVVDAETISSVALAGSYSNTPMQDLKNQNQNMEEEDGENVCLDKETNLSMKSMNGKEVVDSYFDYRGGTGVFIPKVIRGPLKGTGFSITKPDLAYDHEKKKGEKKKQIYSKKKKDRTTPYFEAPASVTLPKEWPYEQYSQ